MVDALVQMALAAGSDALWKPLNHQAHPRSFLDQISCTYLIAGLGDFNRFHS